jgi:hypothetical protein
MGGLSRPAPPISSSAGDAIREVAPMSDNSRRRVPSLPSRTYRERFNRLTNLLLDLRTAATQTVPENKGLVRETFNLLQEIGYSKNAAGKITHAATRRRKRGAPAKRRELYLEIFTLMLESKDVTLGKAIAALYDRKKLCNCGETHTDDCLQAFQNRTTRQQFQTGIRDIKDRLRKSEAGRKSVEQYDALHPDRKRSQPKK